jgi:uncharacterized protein YneF (UPF0154 family)
MEIIFFVIGLIIGLIVTFFITNLYYERVKKDLKNEVTRLRELNVRILSKMEEEGLIEWKRDSQGNIIGIEIKPKSGSIITEREIEERILH